MVLPKQALIEKRVQEVKDTYFTVKKKFWVQCMLIVFCEIKGSIIIDFL